MSTMACANWSDEWELVPTYDPPLLRLCDDIVGVIFEFLDHKEKLQARLICSRWGAVDAALWTAVAIGVREVSRDATQDKALKVASGVARLVFAIAGGAISIAGMGACVIYGGEPGIYPAILIGKTAFKACFNVGQTAVDDCTDALHSEQYRERRLRAREDAFDFGAFDIVSSEGEAGEDVVTVVERQRFNARRGIYDVLALRATDPAPYECLKFPEYVTGLNPAVAPPPPFEFKWPENSPWEWVDEDEGWQLQLDAVFQGAGDTVLRMINQSAPVGSGEAAVAAPQAPLPHQVQLMEEGWVYGRSFRSVADKVARAMVGELVPEPPPIEPPTQMSFFALNVPRVRQRVWKRRAKFRNRL